MVRRFVLLALVLVACGRKETTLAHAERVCGAEWKRRGYENVLLQGGGPAAKSDGAQLLYSAEKDGWNVDLQCWTLDRKIIELSEDMRVLPL